MLRIPLRPSWPPTGPIPIVGNRRPFRSSGYASRNFGLQSPVSIKPLAIEISSAPVHRWIRIEVRCRTSSRSIAYSADPMVRLRQLTNPASLSHGLIRAVVLALAVGWVFSGLVRTKDAMAAEQLRSELSITDPESGEFYRSHTRIGLAAGTSFLIPSEWQGVLPPGSRTFYLESPKKPGIGLVAVIQDATPEELEDHLNEPQVIEEGYVLQPLGSAQRTGLRITAAYHSGD